jgi:phage-related minor tail protein
MTTLGMQGGLLARGLGIGATAFKLLGSAIAFVGRMMLMNPIGLAITAIAVGAFLIYRYWEPIKDFFGGLWDGIRATFSTAATWFGTLPATFAGFGSNIVSGLINGITGGLGAVKDAIVNVASSTVAWFKEKLGIHSPSRVFGELGGFISQGAAIGMEGEHQRFADVTDRRAGRKVLRSGSEPVCPDGGVGGVGRLAHARARTLILLQRKGRTYVRPSQ